jgi:O-antigen/teichoic acid export membrane protein
VSDVGDAGREAPGVGPPATSARTRHLRGSSLLLAGRIMALGVDFAAHVLLVRYLLKADFGTFSYALATVTLLSTLVLLGLPEAIARYTPIYRHRGELDKVLGAVAVAATAVAGAGAVTVAVVLLAPGLVGATLENDAAAAVLAVLILMVPLEGLNLLAQAMFAAFGRVRVVFLRQYVVVPGTRFLVVLLLILGGRGVIFLAVGYVAASVLGLLLYGTAGAGGLLRRLRRERPLRRGLPVREVMSFALPVFVTSIFWIVLQGVGAIALGVLQGPTEVAEYTAVLPPARLNLLAITVFSILFVPTASALYAREELGELRDAYRATASWLLVLTLPVMALTTVFASTFVPTFFGAAYDDSVGVLAMLAAGFFFSAAVGPNGSTLKVFRKLKLTVGIDLASIALGIGLFAALIPPLGATGAAAATLIATVVRNVALQIALRRTLGLRLLERGYVTVAAGAGAALLVLGAVELALDPGVLVAIPLSGIAGAVLVVAFRRILDLGGTFPELARGPLARFLR